MKKTSLILVYFMLIFSSALYADDAPVTSAGIVSNAVPGAVTVPVTVEDFNQIGKFILTITFDTTRVRFVSATPNVLLPGMVVTYTKPLVGYIKGKLVFTWTGAGNTNVSLSQGASLANMVFTYVTGSGTLSWTYTSGSVCQYYRYVGATLVTLNHLPRDSFYINGSISNRVAPVTHAPVLTITASGPLNVPITVNNFTDIGGITLSLEYDPAILTYTTFTKNAVFGSSFLVGAIAGTSGKMLISLAWYGTGVSLPNGSTLCTLSFNYSTAIGTNCALTWRENGPSCEYTDGQGDKLIDLPTDDFYINGSVSLVLIPNFMADNLTPAKNATVHFTDLSQSGATSWNWSFNRTGVVYVNGTSALSKNPEVQFTDGGLYTPTLVVQNPFLTNSVTKTDYLRIGTSGLWTGIVSADWNTTSNWDNYLVPSGTTNVIIPSSAPDWPVFDGNLTLGIHFSTLTLSGSTSHMTITGDLTIP